MVLRLCFEATVIEHEVGEQKDAVEAHTLIGGDLISQHLCAFGSLIGRCYRKWIILKSRTSLLYILQM